MAKFAISRHALTRILEMKIAPEDVRLTMLEPEDTVSSPRDDGIEYRVRGILCCVVNAWDGTLITIVWNRLNDDGSIIQSRFDRNKSKTQEEAEQWLSLRRRHP